MTLNKGTILSSEETTIITKNAKQNLLRNAIIYAGKGNDKSKELICEISLKLGEINYEDFIFMNTIISKSFDSNEREAIIKRLSKYLNGFKQAHDNVYDYALLNM